MDESTKVPKSESVFFMFVSLGVLIQTFALLFESYLFAAPLNSYVFLNSVFDDLLIRQIEVVIYLIFSMTLLYGFISKKYQVLALSSLYFLADAIASTLLGGKFGHEFVIASHAGRILFPLFFILTYFNKEKYTIILFKVAISLTFIFHGISAIKQNPLFMDYVIEACSLLMLDITETQGKYLLYLVGIIDLICGFMIFLRSKLVDSALKYMIFWGFVTALFRIIYHYDLGILPFFQRVSHFIIPLLILKHDRFINQKFQFNFLKTYFSRMKSYALQNT